MSGDTSCAAQVRLQNIGIAGAADPWRTGSESRLVADWLLASVLHDLRNPVEDNLRGRRNVDDARYYAERSVHMLATSSTSATHPTVRNHRSTQECAKQIEWLAHGGAIEDNTSAHEQQADILYAARLAFT